MQLTSPASATIGAGVGKVSVGVGVLESMEVTVGVGQTSGGQCVGERVGCGVFVIMAVCVGVEVVVAGGALGVSVGVAEGVGVGVAEPGVDVAVGVRQRPPVIVTLPFWLPVAIDVPNVSPKLASVSANGQLPEHHDDRRTVAKRPLPVGPSGGGGAVMQPKRTEPTSGIGGRHMTLRPVLPRNGPLVTEMKPSPPGSKASSNS